MRDREFVNRFCAFQLLTLDDYKGDMDDFLALALKKMNQSAPEVLERLSVEFRTSLTNNHQVFDKHAFRKHTNPRDSRSVLNASLWDVMSTGLTRYSEPLIEGKAGQLRNAFYLLMRDDDFIRSITYGPNDARKVRHRFRVAKAMFEEVLDAVAT
jgi:hypothetical protein